jgi:crotonobetainyl-CoA:carnitine CoA-transferase CaiB-like acyl-CoA transferase
MPAARPFDGLRLLDLTTTFAGSLASMHFADFGGDVLRVDSLSHRNTAEQIVANRGKRFADIDISSLSGRVEIIELAQRADVVVTDLSPVHLQGSGLDAATLRRHNQRLIHVWMPPHSTKGAMSELPADELLLSAWAGMADQQPGALEQPVAPVVPVIAYEHGALGVAAIVAALLSRQKTGHGRGVTVTGLHAVAALNVSTMVNTEGLVRPFAGEKSATWGPPNFRVYRCSDDSWLFLAALTAPFFIAALDAIDLMDVMVLPGVDGEFLNVFRPEIKGMVGARLAARFIERSGLDWHGVLDSARVPNALVQSREEWAASETVQAGGMLSEFDHESLGKVVLPGPAVELCESPGRVDWFTDIEARIDPGHVWLDERPDEPSVVNPTSMDLPLDGLRILDVSSFMAGPFTSTVLKNFGATVFKVEQSTGDPFAHVAAVSYAAINRDKSRLILDLKSSADLQSFYALAEKCDAVIDNLSFGLAEKLGIDFGSLSKVNPGIVACSLSAWGPGPLKGTPGFDPVLQAQSGLMAAQGGEGEPVVQAVAVTDIGTGTLSAFGLLAALFGRVRLGKGQQVRTSLASTSLTFQAAEFTSFASRPSPIIGDPAFLGENAHHRLYRCEDGWVAIRANEQSLARFLESQMRDSSRPQGRSDDIESDLRRLTVNDAVARMTQAGVPAAPVLHRNRMFGDPLLTENNFFFSVEDPTLGPVIAVRSFADWEGVERSDMARVHDLGEDTSMAVSEGWPV